MDICLVLKEARARLSDPKRWCQLRAYADENGMCISPANPEKAAKVCLVTAIKDSVAAKNHKWGSKLDEALLPIREILFERPELQSLWKNLGIERPSGVSVVYWNDRYATHADVIAVLDEAIRRLTQ